jgi:16S rRNA (uracil1498-N3)-methyltransferase
VSRRRFFLDPEQQLTLPLTTISGELYRHLVTVLRLEVGTEIILADGQGRELLATIRQIGRESLQAAINIEQAAVEPGRGPAITLYQGLPKGEKVDLILQKATELGAAQIVLFAAARSVPRLDGARLDSRLSRWQRIVHEAARQSGRATIPAVTYAGSLAEALQRQEHSVKLMLWEAEEEQHLRSLLGSAAPDSLAFIVGPEGGITAAEAHAASQAGYLPVTLGRRILRTETASLALLAILQYHWGDLG